MLCCLAKKCLAKFSQKNIFSRNFSFEMMLLLNKFRAGKHMGEERGKKKWPKKLQKRLGELLYASHLFCLVVARPAAAAAKSTTTTAATAAATTTFEGGQIWLGHPLHFLPLDKVYLYFGTLYILHFVSTCAQNVFYVVNVHFFYRLDCNLLASFPPTPPRFL